VGLGLGRPLYVDTVTEEQQRLGLACILVEVNVDSKLQKELELDMSNGGCLSIRMGYP
jgi:hypothetical protein